jgi:NAD(P)H-flavin reductase/ferredoxin
MNTCTIEIADSPIGAFTCTPGQTVLQAAAAAGWQLPHSCGRGICETCRATISGGHVAPAADVDGSALLCRVRPLSDIRIVPARAERVDPQATRTVTAKLYRLRMAAPDVAVLDLRFPAGVRISFKAGQYLQVLIPDEEPRSFSIATPPRSSDTVQLHIRVLPGSRFGSAILPTLEPGDPVVVQLPLGDFYLRDGTQHVVMVAGGTGFAPMQSILEHSLAKQPQRRFTLYWGARGSDGLYGMEQVRRWQQRHANFNFFAVVSGSPAEPPLRAGLVHEAVLADFQTLADCQVYACGAPPMVAAARAQFVQHRALPRSNFFSDAFASPTQPSP